MTLILLVEDDVDSRENLAAVLRSEGHEVVTAANGQEAHQYLSSAATLPSVILLDLMMPVMDGWTFAKRLRERVEIPIVVLSAANDLARHAKNIGAADVVGKPFDLDQLLPKVARAAEGV